ncbi:hypothetical protein MCEMIEM13_02713 [Comamonadaceae bacterium]
MPSVWGVPRVMNRASTPLFSIKSLALAKASCVSNLSSSVMTSIFSPPTPPLAFTESM